MNPITLTVIGTLVFLIVLIIVTTTSINLTGVTARPTSTIKCRANECCKTVYLNQYTETDLANANRALKTWARNLALNKRRNNKAEFFGQPVANSCAEPITICAMNGMSRDAFEKQVAGITDRYDQNFYQFE